MKNHILVVENELQALRIKQKYPALLEGVALFFTDETRLSTKRRTINTVYHPSSIPESYIFKNFPQCDGFVALSI